MILYAVPSDLVADPAPWLDTIPPNAPALIRSATLLVAVAAGRNPYGDPEPTGPEADALRDATCAQVAAWVRAGLDPTSGAAGESLLVKRSELFTGKVEYDTATLAKAREDALCELGAEAIAILTAAGLLYVAVPLFDSSGHLPDWGLDHRPHWIDDRFGADCWPFV